MSPRDTAPDAEQQQFDILGRMSEGQRLRMALQMSQAARDMALKRIRTENPGWTDWEVKRELLRLTSSQPLPPGLP